MSLRPNGRRSFRRHRRSTHGLPKFANGDQVGDFTILRYEGHSDVNKRNAKKMSKAQHWYYCHCDCGSEEYRSQQELVDPRRQKCCSNCRAEEERQHDHNYA